jgi:hypothetical protein
MSDILTYIKTPYFIADKYILLAMSVKFLYRCHLTKKSWAEYFTYLAQLHVVAARVREGSLFGAANLGKIYRIDSIYLHFIIEDM